MQIVASQGQTIYTITQENYAQVLPKLNLQASTLTDINNAMWAGRVVTVHENSISYKGWRGDGYSIIDPNTGAGAYLINGGANGAFAFTSGRTDGWLIAMSLEVALGTKDKRALGILLMTIGFHMLSIQLYWGKDWSDEHWACYISGILFALSEYAAVSSIDRTYQNRKKTQNLLKVTLLTAMSFTILEYNKIVKQSACIELE